MSKYRNKPGWEKIGPLAVRVLGLAAAYGWTVEGLKLAATGTVYFTAARGARRRYFRVSDHRSRNFGGSSKCVQLLTTRSNNWVYTVLTPRGVVVDVPPKPL